MNERIQELMIEAFQSHYGDPVTPVSREKAVELVSGWGEKFAELIVQECIKTIEYRAPGQMGKEGEGWTNGYDDGLKTGAWLLKEHFGIKE
jgi:hypothetical protein